MKLECTLIVEDDLHTAFINRRLIKDMKVSSRVEVVYNGLEAIKFLNTGNTPQLILLDLNMPIMNGLEFLESFNENFSHLQNDTRTVLLSASFMKKDIEIAYKYKILDVILKPLTEEKLNTALNKLISQTVSPYEI